MAKARRNLLMKRLKSYLWAEDRTYPLDVLRYWPTRHGIRRTKALADRIGRIHLSLHCAHTHSEAVEIIRAILALTDETPGAIVECGCFKGGSTAKLSLAAAMAKRPMHIFDSFEGLPAPSASAAGFEEAQVFEQGGYAGTFEEVTANVRQFGDLSVCSFHKGWFEESLPSFDKPIAVAFVDVDLVSSLKTCLDHLYPLLSPGGKFFNHDGHLPTCVDVMRAWAQTAQPRPLLRGLGRRKLVVIEKPATAGRVNTSAARDGAGSEQGAETTLHG
jgi:O-methyltransferase